MQNWLENLMHIPIYANCWILDTASTALIHKDIQTQQKMNEIMGREQSFLPKPGFSAMSSLHVKPHGKFLLILVFYFYLTFISGWPMWH